MNHFFHSSVSVVLLGFSSVIACTPTAQAQSGCIADLDGDGAVNGNDLATVLVGWGSCAACDGDVNRNGVVDGEDLAAVLVRWGGICAPTVEALNTYEGPTAGGTAVTIVGDNLLNPIWVQFGDQPATVLGGSRFELLVLAPSGFGDVPVMIETRGGTVHAGAFSYFDAPTISTLAPLAGPVEGGTSVILEGSEFYGTPQVFFGENIATSVTVDSRTSLRAVAPAGALGSVVQVRVVTQSGSAVSSDAYEYLAITVPDWATLIEARPDPAVVTSHVIRDAISATGFAWRVRDRRSGIEMLLVPPGEFERGCIEASNAQACFIWELPVHQVTLTDPYYMGRFEVTQAEWSAVVGSNPSWYRDAPDSAFRPVERVSGFDIAAFLCKTDLRLPTEAEWENAYRAGTTTAFHSTPSSPGGTNDESGASEIGWNAFNSGHGTPAYGTRPVGLLAGNALGFHDMSGNVSERVSDRFGWYPEKPQVNPLGDGWYPWVRVMRGGCYADTAEFTRGSSRQEVYEEWEWETIGFRVARNPCGNTGAAGCASGSCGVASPNNCCTASVTLTPGCASAECCDSVCVTDAYCCSEVWDSHCASVALSVCLVCTDCP